jgi:hypothetical protein
MDGNQRYEVPKWAIFSLNILGSIFSAWLAMWSAIDFREQLGDSRLNFLGIFILKLIFSRIMDYIHTLAIWTGNYLADQWKTETLVSDDMVGALVNVRLPTDDPDKVF